MRYYLIVLVILMQLISTVTTKGQVVIPKPIRDELNIKPSDRVLVSRNLNRVIIERAPTVDEMMGFIKTKKRYTDKQLKEAIGNAVAEGYRDKIRAGRV